MLGSSVAIGEWMDKFEFVIECINARVFQHNGYRIPIFFVTLQLQTGFQTTPAGEDFTKPILGLGFEERDVPGRCQQRPENIDLKAFIRADS